MTPEQIAALRQLCEQATPGPWKVYEHPNPRTDDKFPDGMEYRIGTTWEHPQLHGPAPVVTLSSTVFVRPHQVSIDRSDAAFIAAARTALPALLDALEEKDKEIARLTECPSLICPFESALTEARAEIERLKGESVECNRCYEEARVNRRAAESALTAERQKVAALGETLEDIANAQWSEWESDFCSADEFVAWAKSRARHALGLTAETPKD